jgi:epoxyqueuosine reductase
MKCLTYSKQEYSKPHRHDTILLTETYIKKSITSKAESLGFIKTGFAKAELLDKESKHLKHWLNKGYDAGMKWIERSFDKRKDVKLIMPDAKTVISLAYNYYTDIRHDEDCPKISRYAWGKDYHRVIKKKLKELCRYIEGLTPLNPPFTKGVTERSSGGFEAISSKDNGIASPPQADRKSGLAIARFYVDDGPVMDKSWAVRAGTGWLGKHTNIINREYGSWIFLSEIITNLEFETYDEPIDDLCGSCRICIDACPTGAIVDDYVLDANLCISYHTIENHGGIPEHIDLHGWVFGCDICQDVCPFNKNDKPTMDRDFYPAPLVPPEGGIKHRDFSPLNESVSPALDAGGDKGGFKTKEELEKITEQEFNLLFSDSPIKRTKYKGWRRNLERCSSKHPKS